jgi:hypothetical protein
MRKKQEILCPICKKPFEDGEPEDLGIDTEFLQEAQGMTKNGEFTKVLFIAMKVVKTVKENPIYFKELLDETFSKLENSFKTHFDNRFIELMKSMAELTGSPKQIGKIQEISLIQRLSKLKTTDKLKLEREFKKEEDIESKVIEDKKQIGIIAIESKKTKKWKPEFIEQIKSYMDEKETEFGILVTTKMPDDALSYTCWMDGVLVVHVDYVELAYLFVREYVKLKQSLENEYKSKLQQLKAGEQIMQELKDAITNGKLDQIIGTINTETINIDESVIQAESRLNNLFKKIKKSTGNIRDLAQTLIRDHIEKIRLQILGKL